MFPKIELAYISDRNRIIIQSLDIYIYLIISQNNYSKKIISLVREEFLSYEKQLQILNIKFANTTNNVTMERQSFLKKTCYYSKNFQREIKYISMHCKMLFGTCGEKQ